MLFSCFPMRNTALSCVADHKLLRLGVRVVVPPLIVLKALISSLLRRGPPRPAPPLPPEEILESVWVITVCCPSPDVSRDGLARRCLATEQGGGGIIKPGDTLLFDVELLGFHEKAKERWEMSAAEIIEDAVNIKVTLHFEICHVSPRNCRC